MKQYIDLVKHVLDNGTRKENRTGVDTISCFNYNYTHNLNDGFPLLTTKSINFKNIVIELLWFLTGTNDSSFLERHKCGIWRPWYNPDGSVNAAYGAAWRHFAAHSIVTKQDPEHTCVNCHTTEVSDCICGKNDPYLAPSYNDQIRWVLDKLKSKPMSRDLVVSAWQPHIAQNPPTPNAYWAPCHTMFILNVQNTLDGGKKLCLHLTQRSGDCLIGIPFNLASYSLLCHLFARFSNLEPGVFGHSIIDAHIYCAKSDGSMSEYDHTIGAKEQLNRTPKALPKLIISDSIKTLDDVEKLLHPSVSTDDVMKCFVLENYKPAPAISFKVAV
jgi:thymidylate synthase